MGNLWVPSVYNQPIMTERATLESFIVHVYRLDTEDPGKIVGVVEPTDGRKTREPFTDLDGLGAILSRSGTKRRRTERKGAGGSPHE